MIFFVQMAHLNMAEDIVPIPARSAAALNRYIYYPDHLVRMPGPDPARGLLGNIASGLVNIGREPIFAGAVQNLINEVSIDVRPNTVQDESVGDFVTRRFGPTVAENLVSAILHGIYAGDLYKLSIKTIFPLFWHLEKISRAGILGELGKQMWRREKLILWDDFVFDFASSQTSQIAESDAFGALREKLEGSSVYTFKKGLAQLSEKIEADLQENKNVQIKHISAALAFDAKTKRFAVTNADSQEGGSAKTSDSYDYVVATIPPSQLSQALKQPKHMTQSSPFANMLSRLETAVSSVNVMVINLFYRNPSLVPVSGFGYLIPRSVPIDQNPERALGVIFGSETSRGSSTDPSSSTGQDSAIGTKLTVMMGGHWWNSWSPSDLPDEETAIKMARAVLKRHLGITDPPIVAKARMQWNAIPQYEVGHNERMGRLHEDLRREFDGRLKVAGSSYQGVGVNDCIKAGKKAALDIREGLDERTGLENFGADVRYALLKLREGAVFFRGWAEEAPDLEDE